MVLGCLIFLVAIFSALFLMSSVVTWIESYSGHPILQVLMFISVMALLIWLRCIAHRELKNTEMRKNGINPEEVRKLERIQKKLEALRSWCISRNINLKKGAFNKPPTTLEYGCYGGYLGYYWFSGKDLLFCQLPEYINLNKIYFIKYDSIEYYTKDGNVNYTTEITNTGKDFSLSGAVVGGLIAGEVGTYIGATKDRNKIESTTVVHDDVTTYIYYTENNEVKRVEIKGSEFYEKISRTIPEKEYSYLVYMKSQQQ